MNKSRSRLLPSAGERIAISEFVERALYDTEFGYYTANIKAVGGPCSDFSTSASLDPGFAEALTRWIESVVSGADVEFRGAEKKWHLIELGAGAGHLAAGILRSLGWRGRRRSHYHIVEISSVLREAQRRSLGHRASCVTWHAGITEALRRAGGRAIVFSNEFTDAFPPAVVQWDAESKLWYEVYLEGRGGGRFAEVLVPLRPERGGESVVFDFSRWDAVPLVDGQRCEVLASWRRWLESWAPAAESVALLTVDYGDTFPAVYRGRRQGTLRAYHRHQRLDGIEVYANPGLQDLTTDVNFTDLQHWGEAAGFNTVFFESQRDFLMRFGSAIHNGASGSAGAFLLDPAGAGEAFRVLYQLRQGVN